MNAFHLIILFTAIGWSNFTNSFWRTEVEPANKCLLKTFKSSELDNEGNKYDLVYDANGNLISGSEIEEGDSYPITFQISGDTSMFITTYAADEIDIFKFIYKNGLLVEKGYNTDASDGSGYLLTSRYFYDTNRLLIYSLNYRRFAKGEYQVTDSVTYSYNDSKTNIIESVSYVAYRLKMTNGWKDTISVKHTLKYTYDKKINPIKNNNLFYINWSAKEFYPLIMSDNNAIHIEKIFNSRKNIYDRKYIYNDKGYPVKLIKNVIVKGDTSTSTTYFEYYNCN